MNEATENGHWSCCSKHYDSVGCTQRFRCCYQPAHYLNAGCKTKWSCCGAEDQKSDGCIKKFSCCGKRVGNNQQNHNSACKARLTCCNAPKNLLTGIVSRAGCANRYLCCNSDNINHLNRFNSGCKAKWTCCDSKIRGSAGCVAVWNCCQLTIRGVVIGIDASPFRYDGCEQVCDKCGELFDDNTKGCDTRYKCCNGGLNARGCKDRHKTIYGDWKYSCCGGGKDSQGCKSTKYYTCCNKIVGSKGCGVNYTCCKKFDNELVNNGCITYYACCNAIAIVNVNNETKMNTFTPDGSTSGKNSSLAAGCVVACCGANRLNLNGGCEEVCKTCGGKWNDPSVKGCNDGKEYQHKWVQLQLN